MKWAFSMVVSSIMIVGLAVSATAEETPRPATPEEQSGPKSVVSDPPKHQTALTHHDEAPRSSGTLKVVSGPSSPDEAELQSPSVEIPQGEEDGSLGLLTAGG